MFQGVSIGFKWRAGAKPAPTIATTDIWGDGFKSEEEIARGETGNLVLDFLALKKIAARKSVCKNGILYCRPIRTQERAKMNKTTTIRVSKETYESAKSIARKKNEKIQNVIEEAVREYTKKQFYEDLNASFTRLKSNSEAWDEEEKERAEWDGAIWDGLVDEDGNQ